MTIDHPYFFIFSIITFFCLAMRHQFILGVKLGNEQAKKHFYEDLTGEIERHKLHTLQKVCQKYAEQLQEELSGELGEEVKQILKDQIQKTFDETK